MLLTAGLSQAARRAADRPARGGQSLPWLRHPLCIVCKASLPDAHMTRGMACAARGQLTALQWEGDTCNGCSGASSPECVQTIGSQPQSSCTGARWACSATLPLSAAPCITWLDSLGNNKWPSAGATVRRALVRHLLVAGEVQDLPERDAESISSRLWLLMCTADLRHTP